MTHKMLWSLTAVVCVVMLIFENAKAFRYRSYIKQSAIKKMTVGRGLQGLRMGPLVDTSVALEGLAHNF